MPTRSLSRALCASALSTVVLGAAVATPLASAAEVTVPGKCYIYWKQFGSQGIPVNVTGLAASQSVKVSLLVKGQLVSGFPSLTADTTGALSNTIQPWTSGLKDGPTRSTKASVVVTDLATGTDVASTDFKVANVGFKVDGAKKRAGTKRSWEISGLASVGESIGGGKVYYAYYFKGDKQVGKQRLGKSQDACGYAKVKKPLLPFKKTGTFTLRVQAATKFKKDLPYMETVVQSYLTYN